jgi:hypothetical protein
MLIPTAAHLVAITTLACCGLIAIALVRTVRSLDA